MSEQQEIINRIRELYCFYHQKYVLMGKNGAWALNHYFKDPTIENHLNGKYSLCVYAGEKATKFLTFDVDAGGKDAVRKVMAAMEELGIPRDRIYVSTSGKKGYHVEIFFRTWIYNERAKNLYDLVIWRSELDPKKVEFRPTFTQSIKVPLGIHGKTGNRCWYLDRDTLEPIEDMEYIFQIETVPETLIMENLKKWNKKRWRELYAEMVCEETGEDKSISRNLEFDDKYYEGKRLTEKGTRHETMLEIARDLRMYGANKFQIRKALIGFYVRQDKALIESSEKDVMTDIEGIAAWTEESVPVLKWRGPRKPEDIKPIAFSRGEIGFILQGRTPAQRKIAMLIYALCKTFGSAHISLMRLGKVVGVTDVTASTAIKNLVDGNVVHRQSGGCHYNNGKLVKITNTYFIPQKEIEESSDPFDGITEGYEWNGTFIDNDFPAFYNNVLANTCSVRLLREKLTQPEFEECMRTIGKERCCG